MIMDSPRGRQTRFQTLSLWTLARLRLQARSPHRWKPSLSERRGKCLHVEGTLGQMHQRQSSSGEKQRPIRTGICKACAQFQEAGVAFVIISFGYINCYFVSIVLRRLPVENCSHNYTICYVDLTSRYEFDCYRSLPTYRSYDAQLKSL